MMTQAKVFASRMGLLVLLCIPVGVSADSISQYVVTATPHKDGTVSFVERISYVFPDARHGIVRNLLLSFTDGKRIYADRYVATRDGSDEELSVLRSDVGDVIKIGKANTTINGAHEYSLSYNTSGAMRYFPSYDELYWNAFGANWPMSFTGGEMRIDLSEIGSSTLLSIECYTGETGVKGEHLCGVSTSTGIVTLQTAAGLGKDMTVSYTFTPGVIAHLLPKDASTYGFNQTSSSSSSWFESLLMLPYLAVLGFILFAFYRVFRIAQRNKLVGPIPVQYEPPQGVSLLSLQNIPITPLTSGGPKSPPSLRTLIPAVILDQAVRGALTISDKVSEGVFGFGKTTSYVLHVTKPELITDDGHRVLSMLVNTPQGGLLSSFQQINTFAGSPIGYSSVTEKITEPITIDLSDRNAKIDALESTLLIKDGSDEVMHTGTVEKESPEYLTLQGKEVSRHLSGFIEFIYTVDKEKYRLLKDSLDQTLFEKYLPWAVAYGIESEWEKHFDVQSFATPIWYASHAPFVFSSFAQNFSESAMQAVASSSSSGSGGGGFSGGGGGGGGGGSW